MAPFSRPYRYSGWTPGIANVCPPGTVCKVVDTAPPKRAYSTPTMIDHTPRKRIGDPRLWCVFSGQARGWRRRCEEWMRCNRIRGTFDRLRTLRDSL